MIHKRAKRMENPGRSTVVAAAARALSKREANKLDKLLRIRKAAEDLFTKRGYDETTMRDIAARAKVALGTLFLYASNKRDLLFLIANDVMEDTCTEAIRLVNDKDNLIENYLLVCVLHLNTFGARPELFRLVLRELLFYDSGTQAIRANRNRARLLHLIAELVTSSQKKGDIEVTHDPEFVAWLLFSILQADIRRWIALDTRALADGIEHLWAGVAIVLNGISKKPVESSPSKATVNRLLSRAAMAHHF